LAFLGWLTSQNLRRALQQARQAAWRWRDLNEALEQHVADRTRDLERRARYLETTARVARDTSSVLDLQNLLTRVVTLVSERFGFYHTGVFLVDPAGEWAVLQAASSEGGRRMLARGHRLRVGEEGIVGYVTGRGEPRIALDVGADAVFFDNLDLPDTRSEMALPLRARGEIIGALDVQSKEPQAFSDEDVAVLQTLADQVAMAISNARLFQRAQESLEAGRRAYGEISREAWAQMLRVQPNLGFLSDQQGIFPVGDLWEPQMEVVLQTGEATPGDGDGTTMALPIKVRGQVIGVVDAQKPGKSSEWTAEEVALMETLAEQLGLALESARLYQDTQRRAERERLAGEVTAHIRETLDLDIVLQTAVHDISEALGLAALDVRLDVETGLGNASE
jgi:GAF domain-containing protein